MPTAALYLRVSSDEQRDNYSLPTQADACAAKAAELGYTITHDLRDDHTGTVLTRPALETLRDLVDQHAIDAVICYDPDRLARRLAHQLVLEDEFTRAAVKLIYVCGHYDDTPEGRFMNQIRGAVAEFELAKIQERTSRGRRGRLKAGHVITPIAPFGYRYVRKTDDDPGHLEIDEREAATVRQIFEWFVHGDRGHQFSEYGLAEKLTLIGIPTRYDLIGRTKSVYGYGVWAAGQIHQILVCETYAGVWHYGKTSERAQRPTHYRRPKSAWIPVTVPAIVNRATWHAAQDRLAQNAKYNRRNTKHPYLMRQRLTCTTCGSTMTTHPCTPSRYICRGAARGIATTGAWQRTCHNSLRTDLIDNAVWAHLVTLLTDPPRLIAGLKAIQSAAATATTDTDRIAELQRDLTATQRQQQELLDLYHESHGAKKVIAARLDALVARADAIQRNLDALVAMAPDPNDPLTGLITLLTGPEAPNLTAHLNDATHDQRLALVTLFDLHGTVAWSNPKPDTLIHITGHLPPTSIRYGDLHP